MTHIEKHTSATVHNGWSVTTTNGIVVCSTRAQAERIAQLLERHGWIEAPLTMPPDPFLPGGEVVAQPLTPGWFVRLARRWFS